MMLFKTMTSAALATLMPAAALAQPAGSAHQHAQSAPTASAPAIGQPHGMQDSNGRCDCCATMKEMMQMMHKMHQSAGDKGPDGSAAHQNHEGEPKD